MRISKLWLNGYGRFFKRTLQLSPGLQLVLGPNEQGKTTLRNFVGDMLYGQKRSGTQRIYDEAHELRRPWSAPTCYGGQMVYVLDDGREIEIRREFDKKQESVQVFDLTHGQDITGQFEMLRNRELDFAQAHLGLSKAVFLSTASIGHMSLEHLGDNDALIQIREKILALADSGAEENSSESAIKAIDLRLLAIGRNNAKTKPLPGARARLAELDEERERALALRHDLSSMEQKRRDALDRVEFYRDRRVALDSELRLIDRVARAERLQEAERLVAEIDEATKRCFALGSVREFPLEQQHDVQRAANLVATAQAQLQRSEAERKELERQLEEERRRLGAADAHAYGEIPEVHEQRLAELESAIDRLRERLDEVDAAVAQAERRVREAQADLERLPDFSRLSADPVQWLNQLANSFRLAQHSRDAERQALRKLSSTVEKRRAEVLAPEQIFGDRQDFTDQSREFLVQQRIYTEQSSQLQSDIEAVRILLLEHEAAAPGLGLMSLVSLASAGAFVGVAVYTRNWSFYIPAGLCGVGFLYYLSDFTYRRLAAKRARADLTDLESEIESLERMREEQCSPIESLIEDAGCGTLRELEALYDKYREDRGELASLEHSLEAQEQKVRIEDERVKMLYERVCQAFQQVGEEIADELQINEAASRAIARYQEYRDAKRRLAESREQVIQQRAEQKRLREQLDEQMKDELALSLEVRQLMRDNGFADEARHDSALNALRAYRLRWAQLRQKRGRIEVLQEKFSALERRLEAERKDLAKHEDSFSRFLRRASVQTIDEWHERAEQAKDYRDTWRKRGDLKQQLDNFLRGEDLEALRIAVDDVPVPETPARGPDEIKQEIADIAELIDNCQKEAHALHIALTERSAGMRSLNEIEEERAEVARRLEELEFECEAAACAATVIEDVARDKHSRIAPRLAQLASGYLSRITDGAYGELLISRDLRLSVRIPQTEGLSSDPERRLSKGTVDQIYLALRLAMVQSLNEAGETIPMLLDDPFANYDDGRLERAMGLLVEVSKRSQILLFSCREDVARVAQGIGAPILRL
ncbi:MAG: AAA family ATPase [FCB group bacterium]|jgi:uncharacterized protein YhaN|nr:AAA family ATPase [FCB group bacterium]